MTVEEFWAYSNLPENRERRLELVRGEIVETTLPYTKHGFVCAKVGFTLGVWADRDAGCEVTLGGAGVILRRNPDTLLGPDIAYFSPFGRVDELTGWSLDPPTLAVEVLSPNEHGSDLDVRLAEYLSNGVRVVWLLDYSAKCIDVHRPGRGAIRFGFKDTLTSDELPGYSCPVAEFFRLHGEKHAPSSAA